MVMEIKVMTRWSMKVSMREWMKVNEGVETKSMWLGGGMRLLGRDTEEIEERR